jgi:hypothetical protein
MHRRRLFRITSSPATQRPALLVNLEVRRRERLAAQR